eukprot:jgi/Tetstr1/422522/TSEL_001283.t1
MRHRVRRNWHAWADIGAGRPVVNMIRNGVRIPFKSGPGRFAPFSQRVSMEDATPDQLRFMDDELLAFWLAERGKKATARDVYEWGAILNETTEARGFWYDCDNELNIAYMIGRK